MENFTQTDVLERSAKGGNPEPGSFVEITINNVPKSIHRGRTSVVEIKNLGGIPLADELEQLVDGKLEPLPDGGSVTLKGHEVFLSHVRTGDSA